MEIPKCEVLLSHVADASWPSRKELFRISRDPEPNQTRNEVIPLEQRGNHIPSVVGPRWALTKSKCHGLMVINYATIPFLFE